jgi:hypothetical protein
MDEYPPLEPDQLEMAALTLDAELESHRRPPPVVDLASQLRCRNGNSGVSCLLAEPFGPISTDLRLSGQVATPMSADMRKRLGPIGGGPRKTDVFTRIETKPTAATDMDVTRGPATPTSETRNPGDFQNHHNLKVLTKDEKPKPKTYEEVMQLKRTEKYKAKRLRAKKRKLERKTLMQKLKNAHNQAPLPIKEPRLTAPPVAHVAASAGYYSSDQIISQETREPVRLMPAPMEAEMEDDWEDKLLDADDFDFGSLSISQPVWRKPRKTRFDHHVILPPLPGSSEEPPTSMRPVDYMFYSKPCQLRYYILSDQWLVLERALQLRDRFSPQEVQHMPTDSIQDLVKVAKTSRFRGDDIRDYFCFYDHKIRADNHVIRSFVREVERTRVLCVNTEGKTQKLPNGEPRVNVSIGNFRGTVLYFNDYYIIPEEIRSMFTDPKYTKIGSGLIAEMEQFGRLHVRLRNWVEVGSMRMALYPPAWAMFQEKVRNRAALDIEGEIQIGHGLRYMTQDLVEAEYFPE